MRRKSSEIPQKLIPSRNEEENSAYYRDIDGQRYHFSPTTWLSRASTLPSQPKPNMKRMKTVSSCSNRQSIAKVCNEQLSRSNSSSRKDQLMPERAVEVDEKHFVPL
jgi:hypothetical protein